jgi:hypothetical protein
MHKKKYKNVEKSLTIQSSYLENDEIYAQEEGKE